MAKRVGPWRRKDKGGTFYAKIDGKKVSLKTKDEAEAWQRYKELQNGGEIESGDAMLISTLIDKFLTWSRRHNAEKTAQRYADYLDTFPSGSLTVSELKQFHVRDWIEAKYTDCSPHTQRGALVAIKRVLNWGVERDLIERNPIDKMRGVQVHPRDIDITDEDWKRIVDAVDDADPFKDLLIAMGETGARPQEIRKVEARHVHLKDIPCWLFPREESKGKREPRTIQLNSTARAITERLVLKYPKGPIFRNNVGNPWRADSLASRFATLADKLNIKGLCAYAIRHRFVTNAIIRGVDPISLRQLTGHASTQMIDKVYSKVSKRSEHLHKMVQRATGESA